MSMTNFNYGQTEFSRKSYGKSTIKDREGVDFEPQVITMKNSFPKIKLDIVRKKIPHKIPYRKRGFR